MSARASILSSRDSYDPTTRLQPSGSVHRSRSHHLRDSTQHVQGADLGTLSGNPGATSPLAQSFEMGRSDSRGPIQDEISVRSRPSGAREHDDASIRQRSASAASHTSAVSGASNLSRGNTLRKQKSLSRKSSLKRSGSRRSVRAGSIGGVTYDDTTGIDNKSVFYTPVPTSGTPTDILAARFQGWRKVLKDLISYFREIHTSYEARIKAVSKVQDTVNSLAMPLGFQQEGGLGEANIIFQQHYKQMVQESLKAKAIEQDVIAQLASLRNDLNQKIKEIKSLSGDFKNSIEKEKNNTKKAISVLQDALGNVDLDSKAMVGKEDPYIIRLAVERQVERQMDEENYLHRAYLNIEGSGRELESIVVGEIQKAYKAIATILRKEADDAYDTADQLTTGPINLEKDFEWSQFVSTDPHFSCQDIPLRRAQDLEFPGKFHPAAAEVRAGMLERKSKYLKSYTPGWYVLSPTHLHEFKSADSVYTQAPVMSLYLPDQRLGAHSQPDSNSHKFILKGRQTGGMHRGHSWVFRAESYDTMLAWFDDIKSLTEKTGQDRNDFVRRHNRSYSAQSARSGSSFEDDEADRIPYNAGGASLMTGAVNGNTAGGASDQEQRPQGGRFPSDVQMRSDNLATRLTPSSDGSETGHEITAENDGSIDGHVHGGGEEHGASLGEFGRYQDSQRMQPLTREDSKRSHAARKVPAYETPLPVHSVVPEPMEAEYLMTTPMALPTIPVPSSANTTEGQALQDKVVADHIGYFGASADPYVQAMPEPKSLAAEQSIASTSDDTSRLAPTGSTQQPILGTTVTARHEEGLTQSKNPGVRRSDTDHSVSHFHVPGEYPRNTMTT